MRLWEELTGRRAKQPTNVAMQRGKDLEPVVRWWYEQHTGITMYPACVMHDKIDWLRASLDGINEQRRMVLEIKCTSKEVHQACLDGEIHDYYHAQVQHQLMVTGYSQAAYITHNPWSFNGEQQYAGPLTVERDSEFIKRLYDAAKAFWQCVVDDTPPVSWFGWFKCGRQRKWRRVAEATTEEECGRLLRGYAAATKEEHCETYVGPTATDPNVRVRV
jgi:putative phage-type endonuclease